MKYLFLLFSALVLVLAIFINNGILISLQSDSDSASFGILVLLASIILTILGIRKIGKTWSKQKRIIVNTVSVISIVLVYLFASSLMIYSKSQKPLTGERVEREISGEELTKARNEFISGLNNTLSTVSERSNDFYSISASFKGNNITLLYKIDIENDISISDGPIDALVTEAVKTFKSNGTIDALKALRFKTLIMTFSGKSRENSRKIDINKV